MARILGLDIQPFAVRAALVRTQLRKTELVRYLEVPITPHADPQGRADARRAAIQDVLAQVRPPPDGIMADLGGEEVSLRSLSIPGGAAKKVTEVLPFELESILPFDLDDSVIDHQPIGTRDGLFHLLACAAPRARVAERLEELRDAGVDPKQLAVGAAALDGLVPLIPELQSAGPFAIIDVGETTTDVCILRDGRCELGRTVTGGMDLVRAGRLVALGAALRRTLASFRAQANPPLELVYLCGEAALDPQALEWLSGVAETPTRPIPTPPLPSTEEGRRVLFGRAVALAGRAASRGKHIDLRRGEFSPVRAMGQVRQHAKLIAICAAAVLLSFGFSTYARYSLVDSERETLQEQLASTTKELFDEEVRSARRARELLEGGRKEADPLPRFDAWDVLDAVSSAIPAEITHDTRRLAIEIDDEAHDGRFELQGSVASIAERDTIASQLESHECFGEIQKGPTSPGAGNEGLTYRLEVSVRCPDAPEAPTKRGGSRGR